MLNLIRRDVILTKKLNLTFIPFILVFVFADAHPILIFLAASVFVPYNAYAYDEMAETGMLLNSLPYTRKEIIASRYIGAIFYMIVSIALACVILVFFGQSFTFTDIAIGISLFLIFASMTFPLFYILKQGYVSIVVLFGGIIMVGIGPKLWFFFGKHLTTITEFIHSLSTVAIYTLVTVVTIAFYVVSRGFTTFIYQRKAL